MANIEIQVLRPQDWHKYKGLRLASLQDAPDAFGSTYQKEVNFAEAQWRVRLDVEPQSKSILPLVATSDGVAVGLAFGMRHNPNDQTIHVYQMWVAKSARGYGIGQLLLQKIIDWAVSLDADFVSLEVTVTNFAAVKLYQAMGFKAELALAPLREGSTIMVQTMSYKI
ncbi:GNAT family N-acetyltransferase [Shewanella sp. KX20019]|uniref:GNAT family N-acetyltransferase n=1 Tax=Shewanella sp. KX20019 TaxID=2803864 RepID=UPI0019289169|nr:GNAT family N-acetyltransferase [Shewanella sp. KX20019]QQX81139.1 GNAT family N-acetyltransferase [Shewanella sp. KX20019]